MMIQFRALSYFVDMAPRLFHKIEVLSFKKMYGGTCHPKWYQQPPWLMDYTDPLVPSISTLLFQRIISICLYHSDAIQMVMHVFLFNWLFRCITIITTWRYVSCMHGVGTTSTVGILCTEKQKHFNVSRGIFTWKLPQSDIWIISKVELR